MEPPPHRQSKISSAFVRVTPKPGGFTAKGVLIPSGRVPLAGFTCSSPTAMPRRAALLPRLATAGHGPPKGRKAESSTAPGGGSG